MSPHPCGPPSIFNGLASSPQTAGSELDAIRIPEQNLGLQSCSIFAHGLVGKLSCSCVESNQQSALGQARHSWFLIFSIPNPLLHSNDQRHRTVKDRETRSSIELICPATASPSKLSRLVPDSGCSRAMKHPLGASTVPLSSPSRNAFQSALSRAVHTPCRPAAVARSSAPGRPASPATAPATQPFSESQTAP